MSVYRLELSDEEDEIVGSLRSALGHETAEDVLREALVALRERQIERSMRAAVEEGLLQLERGDVIHVADVDAFIADVAAEVEREFAGS